MGMNCSSIIPELMQHFILLLNDSMWSHLKHSAWQRGHPLPAPQMKRGTGLGLIFCMYLLITKAVRHGHRAKWMKGQPLL